MAVKCSNNPPAEPMFGALRIVNEDGSPSLDGTGRLQVFKSGEEVHLAPQDIELSGASGWGSICDDGWTKESERVACMQMGYSGMKVRTRTSSM